jgi:hypothetical protein
VVAGFAGGLHYEFMTLVDESRPLHALVKNKQRIESKKFSAPQQRRLRRTQARRN